jgi:hypothetical protein
MAIHKMIQPTTPWDLRDIDINVQSLAVQGKMICAQIDVDNSGLISAAVSDDESKRLIKKALAEKIAECMFNEEMIEYSIQDNGPAYGTKTVRARAFVTPDNQVRLLKIHAK